MITHQAAVVQAPRNPRAESLRTDPFAPGFRAADLEASARSWLALQEEQVRAAAAAGAALVLLTEDITHVGLTATYLDDPGVFRAVAVRQAEQIPAWMGGLAGELGIHLAASFFCAEGDEVHNVADLVGPDGTRLGRYRKVHLPAYERWQVSPGREYPVFECELGRVGMLICYDQTWPEPFACLALGGAEIVLIPSAAYMPEYRVRCRGMDHKIFCLCASPRRSIMGSPDSRVLAQADDGDAPVIIEARLEPDLVRYGSPDYYDALYSGLRDHRTREQVYRRPDTYSALTAGSPAAQSAEEVARIYRLHREARRRIASGDSDPYHWDYDRK